MYKALDFIASINSPTTATCCFPTLQRRQPHTFVHKHEISLLNAFVSGLMKIKQNTTQLLLRSLVSSILYTSMCYKNPYIVYMK